MHSGLCTRVSTGKPDLKSSSSRDQPPSVRPPSRARVGERDDDAAVCSTDRMWEAASVVSALGSDNFLDNRSLF